MWVTESSKWTDTVSVEGTTEATNDTEIRILQYQYEQDSVIKIDHYGRYETLTITADFPGAFGSWGKNK